MASILPATRNGDHNNDASWSKPLLSPRRPSMSTDERVLSASASVRLQLPTGSVMAFQALSSSFTNQGECYPSNWWLSFVLVVLLTVSCVFFSFTDSFFYDDKLYYGVALPPRLFLFNLSHDEEKKHFNDLHPDELKKRGLRWDDYMRAFFTAAVFLGFAAGEVGIQDCFFPQASVDAKQLLRNVPLLVAVLSGFVFVMCPTRRKSIDFLSIWGIIHPSVASDRGKRARNEYDEEAARPSLEEMPVQATSSQLHTLVKQMAWAHDDLEIVYREREVIVRNKSESNLFVPKTNLI